ncbi:serine/threonine-protein kinase [Mycobacterium sp. E1386]|uniref:serine/threonine-protein kinase n=1 Tax=Mycobacterium sp. E1386 TaxID=1834126 RepID=UPI0009EE4DFE|nr:serine/threonine-protein kinase [Mycobacterium sp. E1386]
MPLLSGATFAGYTILRLLGSGGMGEVYLAQHPRLPRRDALKILLAEVSADHEFRERFNREAELAATLWHPHIVGVHDRGEFDGQLWISMDYVEGTDAAQLMRDRYPVGMPADEVLTIVTAVAEALDYAHQRGLLHRDVKPANILLTNPDDGERRVYLSDFGIARQLGEISGLTATNLTVATLPYAAPEQLRSSEIDGRADQYALAATAFQLFSGAPPYQDSNPVAVISQHLSGVPPKLSDRRPELARLDHVLSKSLAKDPADRFSRCRDFAAALREQVGEDSLGDRRTESRFRLPDPPGTNPRTRRPSMPRMLVGAALAVAVLAAASVVGYLVHRENHMTSTPAGAAAPQPVLNGTYRAVFDYTKMTSNGAPIAPPPNLDPVNWWAFRSLCASSGCVANVAGLNKSNPQVLGAKEDVHSYRFADGSWHETPFRHQVNFDRCMGENGTIVPGSRTQLDAKSLQPQSDGTLHGFATTTVLTNECGEQGQVIGVPFVATRTGDVPPGVTVPAPDPAGVTAEPTTRTPSTSGPVLAGAYRIDYDFPNQTVNGQPATGVTGVVPHWWAFRSSCASTRCVATGAGLADNNQQAPAGSSDVVQFTDGSWQDTPYLQDPAPCPNGKGSETDTISWSLQPQPDGTLHGTQTDTVVTNECGLQRYVYKTPLVATRIGDVPPAVILADPNLF